MAKIAAANVAFGGSAAQLSQAADAAERRLRTFQRNTERIANRARLVGGGFLGGVLGLTGVGGVSAIGAELTRMSEAIDATQKAAQRLGTGAGTVRAFELLAELNGSTREAGVKSIERLMKSIGDARFSPEIARNFEALGLSVGEMSGARIDESFLRVLDALRTVTPTDQASLAARIFGREGARVVLNQLQSSNAELERMIQLVQRAAPTTAQANAVAAARDRATAFGAGFDDVNQRQFARVSQLANLLGFDTPDSYETGARARDFLGQSAFGSTPIGPVLRALTNDLGRRLDTIARNTEGSVPR